jgi:uncharacterized membrane protein
MSDQRLPETKELIQPRRPMRKVNEEHKQSMSRDELLALVITQQVGTLGFFLIILAWTILWLGWNILAPASLKFDPPTGFVFWLFISNMIQILLMPLIMVGQNLQGRHAELRVESDYEVNVRAEEEIERIIQRLEEQQKLLEAIDRKLASNAAATNR